MGHANRGPLGSDINHPTIDGGTNSRSEHRPARSVGSDTGSINAVPISPIEAQWNRTKDWFSEMDDALGMLAWWALGSPSMGTPHGGDMVFGPGDSATEHIKNTAAYEESVQIYKEWLNAGQPPGKFKNSLGTESEYVSDKGYFYVKGRAAAGSDAGPRADATQVLKHPVWAYTGQFAIRFTDTGYPKEGYVSVEIENYTSLPSYLHGIGSESLKVPFLEKLYTKRSGIPLVSRSRQVYRFLAYIPRDSKPTKGADESSAVTYKVVGGDSLSAIAKAQYGDMELWPIIYDRNRETIGSNPDRISVGQSLVLPAKDKLTAEQIKQAKQTARLRRSHPIPAPPLR
jgi:hypothetical protein